jgi:hypothetical protein
VSYLDTVDAGAPAAPPAARWARARDAAAARAEQLAGPCACGGAWTGRGPSERAACCGAVGAAPPAEGAGGAATWEVWVAAHKAALAAALARGARPEEHAGWPAPARALARALQPLWHPPGAEHGAGGAGAGAGAGAGEAVAAEALGAELDALAAWWRARDAPPPASASASAADEDAGGEEGGGAEGLPAGAARARWGALMTWLVVRPGRALDARVRRSWAALAPARPVPPPAPAPAHAPAHAPARSVGARGD